jgi:hypothetical protein
MNSHEPPMRVFAQDLLPFLSGIQSDPSFHCGEVTDYTCGYTFSPEGSERLGYLCSVFISADIISISH